MRTTLKYVNVPEWNLTIGAAPKIGSSTVHESLKAAFEIDSLTQSDRVRLLAPELVTGPTVILTRDPVDRFRSLYLNKCVPPYGRLSAYPDALQDMSPEELFLFTRQNDDHHWLPLSKLKGYVPDATYVPLDKMSEWWERIIPVPMIHSNKTAVPTKDPLTQLLRLRIKAHYIDDLQLHKQAERDYERYYD